MVERCAAALVIAALAAAPAAAKSRVPRTRYDFAGRCLTTKRAPEPLYFKATGLGTYLISDRDGKLLTAAGRGTQPVPSPEGRAPRLRGNVYSLRATAGGHLLALGGTTRLRFTKAEGCRPYPELATGAVGK